MRGEMPAVRDLRTGAGIETNHPALRGRQLTEEQLAGVDGDDRLLDLPRGSVQLDTHMVSDLRMMAAIIHEAEPLSRPEPDSNPGHQRDAICGMLSIICSIVREAPTFMSRRSAA